ncbi:MAG TPA: hypothetical protein VHQ68_02445 [Propionibacteriaceae bacterium]|nr:hypothetical protein [Propionibacteriaceae bacterium]
MPSEEQVTGFDDEGTLCSERPRDDGWPDKVIAPHDRGDGMET